MNQNQNFAPGKRAGARLSTCLLALAVPVFAALVAGAVSGLSIPIPAGSIRVSALIGPGAVVLAVLVLSAVGKNAYAIRAALLAALGGAFLAGMTGGAIPWVCGTAVALSATLSASLGAFLVSTRRISGWSLFPLAALGYLLALAITRNYVLALLALVPLAASAFLCHAEVGHAPRAEAVARTAVGFFVAAVTVFAFGAFLTVGSITVEQIVTEIDALRPPLVKLFLEAGAGMLDQALATSLVDSMFNLLPALFILIMEWLGWCTQSAFAGFLLAEGTGEEVRLTESAPSAISAILYFGCTVVGLVGSTSLAATVVNNLSLVLLPVMAVEGGKHLISGYRLVPAGPGAARFRLPLFPMMILIFTVIFYGVLSPVILLDLLALYGAVVTMFRPLSKRLRKMQEEMDHRDNHPGGSDDSDNSGAP